MTDRYPTNETLRSWVRGIHRGVWVPTPATKRSVALALNELLVRRADDEHATTPDPQDLSPPRA